MPDYSQHYSSRDISVMTRFLLLTIIKKKFTEAIEFCTVSTLYIEAVKPPACDAP